MKRKVNKVAFVFPRPSAPPSAFDDLLFYPFYLKSLQIDPAQVLVHKFLLKSGNSPGTSPFGGRDEFRGGGVVCFQLVKGIDRERGGWLSPKNSPKSGKKTKVR